ncbi:MAG: acetyl-CoA carboxylase carboxyltransferase subunit alpha [Chloroflexota bacterium]|nr:acetyl-CoA carboxylase carboxyltransferase subunit alpha [Chloroflexota bacterium]
MDVVDRLLGTKKTTDGNGHLPKDAGLITDAAALTSKRTAWESVQLARELKRPHSIEVIDGLFERFQELHGDRGYRDDPAVVGGIAELDGVGPVVVVAQQRGATTEENIARSFGMPYPEGYRKAIRLYRMAEKFHLPLVTLVDTPGAYPGPEAEERGQAEAIAKSIATMCGLQTPIVAIILGEGGSGGALALAVGDVVLALQNAIYSVISPEGAAAILWRSATEAEKAANALKLAASDLLKLGIVDGLIPEPSGGAHTDPRATITAIKSALIVQLDRLGRVPIADLLSARYERYRHIGVVVEPVPGAVAVEKKEPFWRRMMRPT